MRGRVMSLNAIAFLGSTPIGAPLLGYLSDVTSPRLALAVGGVATLLAMHPACSSSAARQRRRGTEGLVMGPAGSEGLVTLGGAGPANVVPLVAMEPVDADGSRRGERRTS